MTVPDQKPKKRPLMICKENTVLMHKSVLTFCTNLSKSMTHSLWAIEPRIDRDKMTQN